MAVLLLTVWSLFRIWGAFAWRDTLTEFVAKPGPLYIGLTGALWAALGVTVLWGLEFRENWTPRLLTGSAIAFSLWYWTDRLFLQADRANAPFTLAVNLLVFIPIILTTRTNYFTKERETDERESEDRGTA